MNDESPPGLPARDAVTRASIVLVLTMLAAIATVSDGCDDSALPDVFDGGVSDGSAGGPTDGPAAVGGKGTAGGVQGGAGGLAQSGGAGAAGSSSSAGNGGVAAGTGGAGPTGGTLAQGGEAVAGRAGGGGTSARGGVGGGFATGGATTTGGGPASGGMPSTGGGPASGGMTGVGGATAGRGGALTGGTMGMAGSSGGTTASGGAAGADPGVAGRASAGAGGLSAGGGVAGGGGPGGTAGAGVAPTLTAADFADYQIIQRAPAGAPTRIPVSGTFAGVAAVEVSAQDFSDADDVIAPWTRVPSTSATLFAGTLSLPTGGWYRLVFRGLDGSGQEVVRLTGKHRFGVGMNILLMGQSNMSGYGGTSYTAVTNPLAGLYSNDGVWTKLSDPFDRGGSPGDVDYDAGTGASMVPALVNALASYFPGVPIGAIPAAKGSSPLDCAVGSPFCWNFRNAANPADVTNLYGNSVAKARAAGGVELIVMHQGETDATNAIPGPTYAADLKALDAHYRLDLGPVPLFFCQLGRTPSDVATKNRTDATVQPIRVAQHDGDAPPALYLAATAIDLDVDGTDHYRKASYDTLGRRIAAAIAFQAQAAGSPAAYRGPAITSVTWGSSDRSTIDVHLTHRAGSDFTPSSGINGFVVLDGATPVTIAAALRTDAQTVTLTLAAPVVGTAVVRYLYGKLPYQTLANTVHDDSPLSLPLEPTTDDLTLP